MPPAKPLFTVLVGKVRWDNWIQDLRQKQICMTFFLSGFGKWFPTGGNVGFRLDGGYIYQKKSGVSDATVSGNGFRRRG